jgi:hypothetical protein
VVISNKTATTVTISLRTISGNDSSDFAQTNDCGRTIDAGSNCTISLIFKPTANGTRTGVVTLDGAGTEIRLTGVGK